MRITLMAVTLLAGLAGAIVPAQAQGTTQFLQGLLPGQNGNGGQNGTAEQAVRDAYERGYRQGRQDQERSDQQRTGQTQRGGYPSQNGGYQQPNQYGR